MMVWETVKFLLPPVWKTCIIQSCSQHLRGKQSPQSCGNKAFIVPHASTPTFEVQSPSLINFRFSYLHNGNGRAFQPRLLGGFTRSSPGSNSRSSSKWRWLREKSNPADRVVGLGRDTGKGSSCSLRPEARQLLVEGLIPPETRNHNSECSVGKHAK